MSTEKGVEITVQPGVEKKLGNILFDYEASYELMEEAGFTPEASRALPTHFDMALPLGRFMRLVNYSSGGIYRVTAKDIHLNAPVISRVGGRRARKEFLCNQVWLHEVGHALDDFRGTFVEVKNHRLKSAALVGYLATATSAPVAAEYYNNINPGYMPVTGLAAFFLAGALGGSVMGALDKRQLTASGKNEAFAEQFAKEMYEKYPNIIQLA